jgi:AcrR family transcriptional regulator
MSITALVSRAMNHLAERRQEEKDRRRDEILDAAAAVAGQHGMAAFTMDQVARKARLSRALLYVYFRDKEDLLMGLADRAHGMLHARFVAICAKRQTGLKMIMAMGRAYVAFAEDSPVYFEALACFAAHEPDKKEQNTNVARCLESGDLIHALMIQALDTGIGDGSIRRDIGSLPLVAVTLWGFMHGIIQIIATKGEVLAHKGATGKQLVANALALATRALAKD